MKRFFGRRLCALLAAAVCIFMGCAGGGGSSKPEDIQYNGIDISQWQGEIDFARVKAAGIQVVYIRSGEGVYADPYAARNFEGAKAQGLKVGFYHYVTARTVEEARRQAQAFVTQTGGMEPDCKPAMDYEDFGGLEKSVINQIALVFLQETERLGGKEVLLYSDSYNAQNLWTRALTAYPLWVADYGAARPKLGRWTSWVGFQHSGSGLVDGISTEVDLDYFTNGIFLNA